MMKSLAFLVFSLYQAVYIHGYISPSYRSKTTLFVSVSAGDSVSAFASAAASSSASSDLSWDWQKVTDDVFKTDKRPVILFDGVCNLCNGGVNFALDHDKQGAFRFVSLQSKIGKSLLVRSGRAPGDMSSIVLCTHDGKAYFQSDAILRIAQGLDALALKGFGSLGLVTPRILRDGFYELVAENRYRFGETDSCRMDWDGEFDDRFIPDPED
mmetsp:Transcript_4479/g.7761  ORF Transcript_4479/g.7761 Transcript_4479/m.7761 type:complete len:212 (-) Transcript_4479:180-815(-)